MRLSDDVYLVIANVLLVELMSSKLNPDVVGCVHGDIHKPPFRTYGVTRTMFLTDRLKFSLALFPYARFVLQGKGFSGNLMDVFLWNTHEVVRVHESVFFKGSGVSLQSFKVIPMPSCF